jgi:glycine oxidase
MNVEYIIVGLGLAGVAICEQLQKHNKSFLVYDSGLNISSTIAGGLYNPVTLKRFTASWDALSQINTALPFYEDLETKLQLKLDYKTPVNRIFASVEEQNLWFEASDKPVLSHFIIPEVKYVNNNLINAPYGLGEVAQSGRIDTSLLIKSYRTYLVQNKKLIDKTFEYENLITESPFSYDGISAQHIIFAEGFGIKKNPWFKDLPLNGNKGELLTIKAPDLKLDIILKSSVFIIPLGNDLYRVGATYNHEDKTITPTQEAKTELLQKLNKIINCPFEVIQHEAGIRPTTIDRKPLVGEHPQIKNMFVLNGLGSRGVMIAPSVAQKLFEFIEIKKPLDKEICISRII